jgi:hypothetical protein
MENQMEKYSLFTAETATTHLDDSKIISRIVVTVATKKVAFAGTEAKVFLNLGTLGNFELNTPGEDDFETGTIKSYEFETNFTMGEIRNSVIELGHDNTGKNPGWCVGGLRIEIILQDSEIRYMYKLWEGIGWLATDKGPFNTTSVVLQ